MQATITPGKKPKQASRNLTQEIEVAKIGPILLVNLLQSSKSTFSWGNFLSFFACKEGMLSTPISVLGGWPTVSGGFPRLIDESAVGVYKSKVFYDSALLSQQASIMASATPTTSVRGTST
jgi:hypothetical protein